MNVKLTLPIPRGFDKIRPIAFLDGRYINTTGDTMTGALLMPIIVVTASTITLDRSNFSVMCDCTNNTITVNLPSLLGNRGLIYNIKKIDVSVNAVTVDASGSETIDGVTTKVINTQYDSLTIQAGPDEWHII